MKYSVWCYEDEYMSLWASMVAQLQRIHLPMQETQIQSLGQEDPLEKETATHFSVLAWEIPWTKEPCNFSPWGCQESNMI